MNGPVAIAQTNDFFDFVILFFQDERGLRQLIDAGCYRAAINLTTRLLLQLQQGQQGNLTKHSPYSIRVQLCHI